METIKINSGCKNFILISAITSVSEHAITGRANFNGDALYLGIEACAQICALHTRYLAEFNNHAFLIKIDRLRLPAIDELNGLWHLNGNRKGFGNFSFSYHIKAQNQNGQSFDGKLLLAVKSYDENFKKEILKPKYKDLFACLMSASKNASPIRKS